MRTTLFWLTVCTAWMSGAAAAQAPAGDAKPLASAVTSAGQAPLRTVLQQIAEPAGVRFQVAPELAGDTIPQRSFSGDWTTVIRETLRGYNYVVTQDQGGRLAAIAVTGRSGDGREAPNSPAPAEALFRYRDRPASLPAQLRNRKAESVFPVELPTERLRTGKTGERFAMDLPDGRYQVVQDNTWPHDNGDLTWVGRLEGLPVSYRAILTVGADGGVVGRVLTPAGLYQLEPGDAGNWLVDVGASGLKPGPLANDDAALHGASAGIQAMAQASLQSGAQTRPKRAAKKARAASTGTPVVDLLVLYTRPMESPSLPTRLNNLVDLVNQALKDSRVDATVRLARSKRIRYPNGSDSSNALDDLTANDGAFSNVNRLRRKVKADAVVLLRRFQSASQGSICGIAWVNGSEGAELMPSQSYAVVNYGSDDSYFCSDYTLAHEIGHTLGAAHDREHSSVGGHFDFSYGYGIDGRFGDIMSYYSPEVGLYANPDIVACDGSPCGISADRARGADLARTFNRTARTVSEFR